jgi:hypothetical protein
LQCWYTNGSDLWGEPLRWPRVAWYAYLFS